MTMTMWGRKPYGVEKKRETPVLEAYPELEQGVFMNLKGWPDYTPKIYTDTDGKLIENPADVIEAILCEYGKSVSRTLQVVTSGYGSFTTARTELNSRISGDEFRIRARFAGGTSRGKVRENINKICDQTGLSFLDTGVQNKFRLVAWKAVPSGDNYEYRPAAQGGLVKFGWKEHIVPDSFHAGFTPTSDLYNEVYVNWLYDYQKGGFTKLTYVDANESSPDSSAYEAKCAASQAKYVFVRRLTIDADFIFREQEAEWLRNFTIDARGDEHVKVDFTTYINAIDLLPGQIFEIDSSVDAHVKYPGKASDGSWAGKSIRCESMTAMVDPKDLIHVHIVGIAV
jgi:hypothetical protein